MMFDVFILSLVQSITEFLPVSSSGHLLLLNKFGISNQTMGMDVLLHLGTLLAVIVYFRQDVVKLIQVLFGRGDKKLFVNLFVATLPILFAGFFLFDLIRLIFRSPYLVALNSIFWGIILWLVDKYAVKRKKFDLTLKGAFCIGCGQVLSLIPGTSRSGITITFARALGMNRTDSTHFSMLLSIPTILMTVGYVLLKGITGDIQLPCVSMGIWGVLGTFIMGMLVISFLMKWIRQSSFGIFAIYRILLGIFVLIYMIV